MCSDAFLCSQISHQDTASRAVAKVPYGPRGAQGFRAEPAGFGGLLSCHAGFGGWGLLVHLGPEAGPFPPPEGRPCSRPVSCLVQGWGPLSGAAGGGGGRDGRRGPEC